MRRGVCTTGFDSFRITSRWDNLNCVTVRRGFALQDLIRFASLYAGTVPTVRECVLLCASEDVIRIPCRSENL